MLRALLLDQCLSTFGACRADDTRPMRDGELHRSDANATAGAVDKNSLAGGGFSLLEKRPVSRGIGHADGRALGEACAIRQRMDLRCGADGELGIGTGADPVGCSEDVHAVATFELFHAIANALDDARPIRAGSER